MPRDNALAAQLRAAAEQAGALPSALADFDTDVDVFAITKAEEIPAWIETCKREKFHRFKIQSDVEVELVRAAFAMDNKTAQGKLYNAVGPTRYAEIKAAWDNGTINIPKPKDAGHTKNPWAAVDKNIDKRGRYTDDAIKRQMSLTRAVGVERAAQIAASVGNKLGDLYAAQKRAVS